MDSLEKSLDLSDLAPVDTVAAALDPTLRATLGLLLPRTPLLQLLSDLHGLADVHPDQAADLQALGRLAIARHDQARALFERLGRAVATRSLEDAAAELTELPPEDVRLALQMLHFAGWLLSAAKLPDKAEFGLRIALETAGRFGLTHNRAVVLHELGLFEAKRGRLSDAETALGEASAVFATTAPGLVQANNRARAEIYLQRLGFEDNPPQPADFDAILDADPQLRRLVLPALAGKALDHDDFGEAERILGRLRERLDPGTPVGAAIPLVEARLARRQGRIEAAELLLAQAAAAPDVDKHREELLRQKYYLARDLGGDSGASEALATLKAIRPSARLLYQEALLHWQRGEVEETRRLLWQCLDTNPGDTGRADCFGMLGLCADAPAEGLRYLYGAIGLYLKLDRRLDHAISLSHLAAIELADAEHRKETGALPLTISEYSRADRLYQAAQKIGEDLAAASFILETIANRAQLEWRRGRHSVALRHFDQAARQIELTYLALSDRRQAESFFAQHKDLFERAVACAEAAGNARETLRFVERGKARRLLRDVAEMAAGGRDVPRMYRSFFSILPPGAIATDALSEAETLFVTTVQPLRIRLLQGRPISTAERQALHDAQSRIEALGGLPAETGPRGWEELRVAVFGQAAPAIAAAPDEEIEELPGAGVIICRRCLVYNRIGSTFCAACETIQPKSATLDFEVALGGGTEEQQKFGFAEHLYNRAVHLIHDTKIEEAEQCLDRAMHFATHPDYHFFHALCRMFQGDGMTALADFRAIETLEFAQKYPFWPLPVLPSEIRRAIEILEADPARNGEILNDLLESYAALAARRAEADV